MIDSKLDELLEKWEVCRIRGEQFIPDELCGSDIELRDQLLAQIDGLECMAWMDEDEDCDDEYLDYRNDSRPESNGRRGLPRTRLNGQQFLTALNRVGLLTDAAVQEILQDAAAGTAQANAMPLAEQLVDHGQLTAYQASVV